MKESLDENVNEGTLDELSPATIQSYKKAASKSNYSAAQKYARVAASPTSRKYKNKEMDKQDDIMRKRKAGLAMADKKESNELDERTPIRPTVQDKKLKNLRVPNPKYKGFINRKRKNQRSSDIYREDAPAVSTGSIPSPADTAMGPRIKTVNVTDRRRKKDKIPVLLKRFRKYIEDNA